MNLRSVLLLLTVLTTVLMAHEVAMSGPAAIPTGSRPSVESFETEELPAGCLGGDGSEAISTLERFKSGTRSLRWTWSRPGGSLSIPAPDGPAPILGTECLAFWLYNESPGEDILRLELIGSGKVLGSCWYVLNFKGWRPLGTPYSQVCPQLGAVDSLRLIAPSRAGRGRLYLDYVDFHCPDTPRPDNQQPWIGRPEILHSALPEKFVYSTHDISQNRPWLPRRKPDRVVTAEERTGMATIAERCLIGDTARGDRPLLQATLLPQADPAVLDDLEKSLRLHRSPEGILTGPPIVAAPVWGSWKFNNPPDGVTIGDLFTRLVRAYLFEKAKGREDMAQRLLAACFDVCDHLVDQGYGEGNNNIAASGFPVSCVLSLRKELTDSGRLRPMLLAAAACALTIRGDALMHEDWSQAGYHPRNTDLSPDYSTLLVLTVLLPDEADRLQRLVAVHSVGGGQGDGRW